jgi:molybdate transport system substrate-binding protein
VRRLLLTALVVLSSVCAACGDDTGASSNRGTVAQGGSPVGPAVVRGNVTVLAAASLTDSFTALAAAFRAAHPEARVALSFASSSSLAAQINQGAPADVFASADTANMDKVTGDAGTIGAPVPFATNRLRIIVAKGNPKGIVSLADLAKPGVVYVAAAPSVPIGAYAQQALRGAGVTVTPKSLEADAKAVVAKVTLGEADAGLVYTTDVLAAGDKAQGVTIPDVQNVVATYPIAVVKETKNASAAQAFVALVTSAEGQTVLASFGFTRS